MVHNFAVVVHHIAVVERHIVLEVVRIVLGVVRHTVLEEERRIDLAVVHHIDLVVVRHSGLEEVLRIDPEEGHIDLGAALHTVLAGVLRIADEEAGHMFVVEDLHIGVVDHTAEGRHKVHLHMVVDTTFLISGEASSST